MTNQNKKPEKIRGLVLGGGGARGCYEVGAWQAFIDSKIKFDCVAGTSIGAIVGAIYVQQTIDPLIQFVYDLRPGNIVADMPDIPENFEEIVANRNALLQFVGSYMRNGTDISPLKESLEKMFDYAQFKASPIDYACMTFNVTKMQGEPFFKKDLTEKDAVDVIIASASCFPAFPMAKLGSDLYIDGGYEDNLPIRLCQQMGAEEFVVIDVHGPGRVRRMDPEIHEIKTIQPLLPIANFLDFSEAQAVRSLRIGYLETMKYYDQFCGYLFTFESRNWPKIYMCERYLDLTISRQFKIPQDMPEKAYTRILGYRPPQLDNQYDSHYFYGKLIECLAFEVGMDPVQLYDYDEFLKELDEKLNELPTLEMPGSIRTVHEFVHNRKKEEILTFFHSELVLHNGRLPILHEPLKNMFEVQFYLAYVWYSLHLYLDRSKS